MLIRLSEAAKRFGVHPDTLRRWAKEGKITFSLSAGGHRLFDPNEISNFLKLPSGRLVQKAKPTIAYARVSSSDQKDDLKRQVEMLSMFCAANGWEHEIISDLGSGMNYQKKGLKTLIRALCNQEIGRLVITHKDRLLRFGSELIFSICEHVGCEVVVINSSEDSTYEEDLTKDVLEIITVFSARLYGSRSHKNRKIVESLKAAADEVCK
ncbi:IS607 family transposase [Flavobacterium sp.]|uniref:IS607 family transposase n=1 Tax=Flavobacterium sp. TaxID=239 RepID=UPI0012261C47|nr:IS607 family transposase [Flavobacterium sp.]RZJ68911.1 MAG: IS607 family transposase [Flavobacterium sp.]